MGLLTATLLVFGRFSADQELTAARASGVSLLSLITPILLLSLFCCGLSAWINTDLGPRSRVAYKNLLFQVRAELVNAQLPEGRFIHDFPGYIFYTEKNRGGNLQGVMIFKLENETNVETTLRAPRGQFETDVTNKQLILHLFDARSVTLSGPRVGITASPEMTLNFDLNTATNQPGKPKVSDMTFWQLRDELRDLERRIGLPPEATLTSDELRAQAREFDQTAKRFDRADSRGDEPGDLVFVCVFWLHARRNSPRHSHAPARDERWRRHRAFARAGLLQLHHCRRTVVRTARAGAAFDSLAAEFYLSSRRRRAAVARESRNLKITPPCAGKFCVSPPGQPA